MDSRALFDRVAGWAGKTFSGRLTRQARRAAIRQHRRLHKQADRLASESLEQRALLAAVVAGYEVVNDWGGGFQGAMTLANQDTQSYGDWTVSFDYGADITSIWDARVVSREGSRYTIANAGYNAAFDPGRTVAFGFIGTPTAAGGAADTPTNFTINGEPLDGQPAAPPPAVEPAPAPVPGPTPSPGPTPAPADPAVSFVVTSNWGSGFNGDVTVTNRLLTLEARSGSSTTTAGWTVSFDFDGEIASLWNGTIIARTGSTYTVANAAWNGSLAVGQSATFGFTASPGGAAAQLRNLSVAFDGVAAPTPAPEPAPTPAPEPTPNPVPEPAPVPPTPSDPTAHDWYLSTSGSQIVTANGDSIRLAGVNWFGLETSNFAPHGLWARGYREMMDQMKAEGFNTIRLPYSDQLLESSSTPNGIDFSKNADLQGLNGLEVMDRIVAYAGEIGLRIILDHHRSEAGSGPNGSGLWYTEAYPEQAWIANLSMLATRYATSPAVIGIDLHNEPHGPATWGDGSANDWRLAAERAGNAVLAANPNLLIIVEGVERGPSGNYWWGGNLSAAGDAPVRLNVAGRLVYSAHDYPASVYPQSHFSAPDYPQNLFDVWDRNWGYLFRTGTAPILLGEFGTKLETASDQGWFDALVNYLAGDLNGDGHIDLTTGQQGVSWTYWSWNPNSGDTGGILADDWTTVNTAKVTALESVQFDFAAPGAALPSPLPPVPEPGPAPQPGGINSGNPGDDRWGEAYFAPYVDMGLWPVPDLSAIAAAHGTSLLTLGFLQATPEGALGWAGLAALTPDSTVEQAIAINDSIAAFQAVGGDVMISLGGAAGISLAQKVVSTGGSAVDLAATYAGVIDTYSLNRIDFDIEGAAVADAVSITLRSEALALLQQLRPDVEIWFTLPVLPSGLTPDGLNVVRSALIAGVNLDGINVMAMDYGEWAAPTSGPNARTMGEYAIQSAESTHAQLTNLFEDFGLPFGWNQLGVTPMIGVNDVLSEVFTVADAQALEDFARSTGLGMLSMWSVARDNPGSLGQATSTASGLNEPAGAFSSIFVDYGTQNGLDQGTPSLPAPPPPVPEPTPTPQPEPEPVPPTAPPAPSDGIGRLFAVNPAGPDIIGFDPAVDRLDFGEVSVHNLIVGKLPSGEVAIVNPWAWTPEYQVLQGITFNDLTIENLGVVQNEHLRQDIGGAISWEQGVGPRTAGTVYVRSHEYGVTQVIDGFNPAVNRLSFLYFGTRERLSVSDTAEGLLISVAPTGQSVLLSGVALSDLVPANIEFHHDQIVEDQLEVPFGFTVDQVSMVSRMALLTPQAPAGQMTDGHQTNPGSVQPHDPGHMHDPGHDHGGMDPMDPMDPADPMPGDPMPGDPHDGHDTMPPAGDGFIDLATFGMSEGSDHTHLHELEGGRTPITTEALVAYNGLRGFLGLAAVDLETVGQWAYDNQLTNNSQAWGNDLLGVGLYYSMQGAKVGWIRDAAFDPQILADIQRTARLGAAADVLAIVETFGHEGFREYLAAEGLEQHFINTLKMEPHYAGWMHDRCHGWLDIDGVAIAHDLNHLTVLSHDQMQPFMNDTFDWPQWPALEVAHDRVIDYFQSMVVLGNPVGENIDPPAVAEPLPAEPTPADPGSDAPVVADPPLAEPAAPADELPIATHDKVLAAYFPEWGIYGRNYRLADVPGDKITHLIYSFADLTAAGEMTLFDSYAAVEKRFSAAESVSGEADQWYYPPGDPRADQTIWGNFNQLAQLKEKFPHLQVSIAVGGWTLSDHFSTVVATESGRETFSDSIVTFLTTYEMFDGIDFDWEYPGGGGEAGNSASPNDGVNYALLMADVRAKLDALGDSRGRTYEISVASPAGLDKIANFNLPGLAPHVDFFNVMTYDFHGTWESTTGHQAAFTGDSNGYDIETAVKAYLDAGVAPGQIVLGAPLYTRAWSGVADGGDGGYAEGSSGAAPGTFEAGNYDYKDLLAQVQDPNSGWQLYWDDTAQASYLYNASEDIFSSFETPTSIALKAQWAEDLGLGGMMFWDLSNDATNSPESLIDAAYRSWVIGDSLESIRGSSSLTDEIIVGGDGVITPLEADWE